MINKTEQEIIEHLDRETFTLEELRNMVAVDGSKKLIFRFQVDKALSLLQKEHEVQIRKLSKFETERIIKLKKEHEKEIKKLKQSLDYFYELSKEFSIEDRKLEKEVDELKERISEFEKIKKKYDKLEEQARYRK